MKVIVVLAIFALVGAAFGYSDTEYKSAFTAWMREHEKMYTNEEFGSRFEIFKKNMDFVRDWNAMGTTTVVGLNIFADLSNDEYRNVYLGTPIDATAILAMAEPYVPSSEPLAVNVDWRTKNVVTPIKDQGQCGSCWAFSSTGSIESAYSLSKGMAPKGLSEQNLMDCSTAYGNQGCNGGLMNSAFQYVIANKGIDTETSYPYLTKQTTCHFTTANIGATISSYKNVAAGSEASLIAAINMQPVSVAIDASQNSFQLYKTGIYYEPKCSSTRLDHGVLAVGYGTDDATGTDYYIVKNSWGTSWGTAGYIQMTRNKANNCGIATSASWPVV